MTPPPALTLWGWPVAIAVLTAVGLVGALLGDGAWDWLGWIGLGVPAAAAVWFGLRGRSARANPASSGSQAPRRR